jgi:hypothetical protein
MRRGQSPGIHRMTIRADTCISLLGLAQLWCVRIVAGITLAFHCRHVTNTINPMLIDIMATKTEAWLLLQQIILLCITVRIVTDGTILMASGSSLRRLSIGVAIDTQVF